MTDSKVRKAERERCAEILIARAGAPKPDDTQWETGYWYGLHKAAKILLNLDPDIA